MTSCKIFSCSLHLSNDKLRGRRQKGREKEASGREKQRGNTRGRRVGVVKGTSPRSSRSVLTNLPLPDAYQ